MSDSVFSVPDLSSITTEINIESLSSACNSLDSSISSFNFNSSNFKSKFISLNNNGVGVTCVNSIADAVEKISSLSVAISGFLKTNLANQQSVDESLSSQASESTSLVSFPDDQDYLAGSNSTGSRSYNSGNLNNMYNDSSSVSNKNKNLNVSENKNTNTSKLKENFINELSVELNNIAKNDNKTVASILNDKNYSSIVSQLFEKVASNNSLTSSNINEIGSDVIIKQLLSMKGDNVISDFSLNLVSNYIINIAEMNNISTSEVIEKYSDYFVNFGNEISNVVNTNNNLLDIYDGKSVEKYSSDMVSFIRGVIDVSANEKNISSEELLIDSNYSLLVNDRLKEISSVLKILG